MLSTQIVLLGLALAIDAAIVTFALGLVQKELHMGHRLVRGAFICSTFGIFQGLMTWLGAYVGYRVAFSSYGLYFQIAVGCLFFYMGYRLVRSSESPEVDNKKWGIVPIIILAVATSIDALISGVSLGALPNMQMIALEIGVITFGVCALFYLLSQYIHKIPNKWLFRVAGLIFLLLGVQIFWAIKHLFFRG